MRDYINFILKMYKIYILKEYIVDKHTQILFVVKRTIISIFFI